MTFTLHTLPDQIFTPLMQAFWGEDQSYWTELELRSEVPDEVWRARWVSTSGADLLPERGRASFLMGGLTGVVRAGWTPNSPVIPVNGQALRPLAALLRRELELLIEQVRLQAAHDQLAALVSATPLALYSVTLEGLIKHWNVAAETTLGPASVSVLGLEVNDPALSAAFTALRTNLNRGQPFDTQWVERPQPDGSSKLLELNAAPFSDGTELLGLVGVAREVLPDAQRLVQAERQRVLLESVLAFANDSVLITEAEPVDAPGPRILYANAAFTRTTGYTLEEVLGKTPRILQGPRSDRTQLDRLRAALKAWQSVEVELINYRKDGTPFWVELSIAPVADERGRYTHWISIQRDITDRKSSALQLERERSEVLELAARNVPLAEVLTCLLTSLERALPGRVIILALAGRPASEVFSSLVPRHEGWNRPEVALALLQAQEDAPFALETGEATWWAQTQLIQTTGNQRRGVLAMLTPHAQGASPEERDQLTAAAQLAGLVIARYDTQQRLSFQALHDSLTKLPNRLSFGQHLERLLYFARTRQTQVAVGLLDLDRFKLINDTLGHSAGDLLLQQIATRLQDNLRPGDCLARMGGDEFLLALTGITEPAQIEVLAARLISSLEEPFVL